MVPSAIVPASGLAQKNWKVWYSKHVNCRGFGKNYKPLGEGMVKV